MHNSSLSNTLELCMILFVPLKSASNIKTAICLATFVHLLVFSSMVGAPCLCLSKGEKFFKSKVTRLRLTDEKIFIFDCVR